MIWWKTDSSPERALPDLILTPGSDEIKFLFYGQRKKKKNRSGLKGSKSSWEGLAFLLLCLSDVNVLLGPF